MILTIPAFLQSSLLLGQYKLCRLVLTKCTKLRSRNPHQLAISDLIFPLTPIPLSIIELETLPVSVSAGSIVCKLQIFLGGVSLTVSVESCLDRRGSVHCSGLSNQSSSHLHKVSPLCCDVHLDCCFINLLCSFIHG